MNPSENIISSVVPEDQAPTDQIEKLQINSENVEAGDDVKTVTNGKASMESEAELTDDKTDATDAEKFEAPEAEKKDTAEEDIENPVNKEEAKTESKERFPADDGDMDEDENEDDDGPEGSDEAEE